MSESKNDKEGVMKYYANMVDLSEIPESVLDLAGIREWVDKEDTIIGKSKHIDDMWIRIIGKDEETVKRRIMFLKNLRSVRYGDGVRIKVVKR